MLVRVLEPEAMDTPEEARDYDAMDHAAVNSAFAQDFLAACPGFQGVVLDVGTGTAQIPIVLCRLAPAMRVVAVDLAQEMLTLAAVNVEAAGFNERIRLDAGNGRKLGYGNGRFAGVISNSIIHHIPDPFDAFSEMARVCAPAGIVFVRDLLRPDTEVELARLVALYAGGANDHQRMLFANSLRAALTLAEVQSLVGQLGFPPGTVSQTSDRHWTFLGRPN